MLRKNYNLNIQIQQTYVAMKATGEKLSTYEITKNHCKDDKMDFES